jgi:hypothetical protein
VAWSSGDAVPQDITALGVHQQRALADGEGRCRADAEDSVFVFAERVGMALLKRLECRPRLPPRRYILPFLLADNAVAWGLIAFGMLGAAGCANVKRHSLNSRVRGMSLGKMLNRAKPPIIRVACFAVSSTIAGGGHKRDWDRSLPRY